MQYQLSRIVAGPFLHAIGRPKVTGAENIPASGGAILAANHVSLIDSIFLPLMLDRPVTFSAKASYFTASGPAARLLAAYLRATNQLRMEQDRPRAAQDTLEAALALLREGKLFGIYPEGTRSPDGRLYRGRPGVGWLALRSGLPVIPVALSGTRQVLPPGRMVPRPGRVEVRIGRPLAIAPELAGERPGTARRLIADQVMSAIQELSGQEYVHMFASDRKAELVPRDRLLGGLAEHDTQRMGYRLRRIAPNVITVAGLLLGMRAIVYAFQGQLVASAYLIIFASIVDTLDGAAARLLHASSAFGASLDTVCDAVTVGVAPAVLVYAVYFKNWGGGGFLIAAAWTVAVLIRLAYFQATPKRDPLYFVGLPSPPAANILTGFVLLSSGIWHRYPYPWFVVALIVVLSFLMVSKLRVVKGAYFTPERIVRSWPGRLALLGVVLAAVYPWAAPLVVFSTVLLLAVFRDLLVRVRNVSQRTATAGIGDMDGVATDYSKES